MKITEEDVKGKSLWLWGVSNIGKIFAEVVLHNDGVILGFVDNSEKLQNTIINGIRIYSPDTFLNEYDGKCIIVCCCTEKNNILIKRQLNSMGIFEGIKEVDLDCIGVQKKFGNFIDDAYEDRMISRMCNKEDFEEEYFKRISNALDWREKRLHRKIWEYVFITRVLEKNGLLQSGYKGIGFAVGQEPLPSYFASYGVQILATDIGAETEMAEVWANSNQNALGNTDKLWYDSIISKKDFEERVTYRNIDMNSIPEDIGKYDFCWSSCAIEHLGGLDKSKQFLKKMIEVIKPGGIAVHTTEFNLWSNDITIETGYSVIYRKKDLEEMSRWFAKNGCEMELSFKRKSSEENMYLPMPPYENNDSRKHLNLVIEQYASTSYGIIIKKL